VTSPFEKAWSGVGTGGCLAFDFVNTLDWRGRTPPVELLRDYAELLRWARTAGVLDAREARALLAWSEAHPQAAHRALDRAIEAREAIAGVFQAIARGERVPGQPLARLEAACREAWEDRTLAPEGGSAAWAWRSGDPSPGRPLYAAALDAERLLTTGDPARVRECGDPECAWMFLDVSRNRSRRWCSMEGCGNRNKARRFQKRAAARR